MDKINFIEMTDDKKKILINALGHKVDENGLIIQNSGKPYKCPITKKKVYLKNASILPGSTIIINTSLVSLSEYFSEYFGKKNN